MVNRPAATTCSAVLLAVVCVATTLGQTGVDRQQLLRDLQVLSADDMEGRALGTPGGERARAYVVRRFKESGVEPLVPGYLQPFRIDASRGRPRRSGANVLGVVRGIRDAGHYIVVSAHFDHIGSINGRVFNGANDNASGTAALFALGRLFAAAPLSSSLIVAAFDGEEQGLIGSRAFVRDPPVDRTSLVVNLNLDMIGRDANNRLWVAGTTTQPTLKPPIQRAMSGALVDLRLGHDDPSGRLGDDWLRDSDQYAFIEAGLPALYVGVEDYAQHHRLTDDYGNMTHEFYGRAVETIVRMIRELDAEVPRLIAHRDNSQPSSSGR